MAVAQKIDYFISNLDEFSQNVRDELFIKFFPEAGDYLISIFESNSDKFSEHVKNLVFKRIEFFRTNEIIAWLERKNRDVDSFQYEKDILDNKNTKNYSSEVSLKMSINNLRNLEDKLSNERLSFIVPYLFKGYGEFCAIYCKQILWEIEELFELVVDKKPGCVCEIGVNHGGTFYMWCKAAKSDATIIGIDSERNYYFSSARRDFYKKFGKSSQNIQLLPVDSNTKQTFEYVTSLVGSKKIDFLFIDGDHSYEMVKADFEMYKPLMNKGGIVAFHDIIERPTMPKMGVYRLWNEIKNQYKTKTKEFITPEGPYAGTVGIGVIEV